MDNALGIAQTSAQSSNPLTTLIKLLSKMPGTRDLCEEAERLQESSQAQARMNASRGYDGGSSRGLDDSNSGTRAGPGDYQSSKTPPYCNPNSPPMTASQGQSGLDRPQRMLEQAPQRLWQRLD